MTEPNDGVIHIFEFDMHAAARALISDFDDLPEEVQAGIVRKIIDVVEAGAGFMLEPPCDCTVGEYMAGHKHGCVDHRICEDCRCTSVSPPPFGFQCGQARDHNGIHIDDTETVSWETGPWV